MDGFFEKYGRMIVVAVAICFVLLYLIPMRNVVGSSINGFAGNFANKVGESLGTVKMPDGSDNIKREPSSMLIKGSYYSESYSFNGKIPESATKIVFTDEKAPKGVSTVDLTKAQDGDVVGWLDGTTWKVSTQDSKKKITFNTDSSWMFYRNAYRVKEIQFNNVDTSQVTNMNNMFNELSNLTKLDLSSFDTSQVKYMNDMFAWCRNLKKLDLSTFDTSNVTSMDSMFNGCGNLQELDISHFNTSKVTNMSGMFCNCSNLTMLDLSHLDTRNVTNMRSMFSSMDKIETLDLSDFDTSRVTNMAHMFLQCYCLKNLDLSSFDTSNVVNMEWMFESMSDVEMLDLSSFDTSKVTNMSEMFFQSSKLKTDKVRSKSDIDNIKTKATKTPTKVMFEIK